MQADVEQKISPAFQPFLAESDPHARRDALVVFRRRNPRECPSAVASGRSSNGLT